MSEREHGFIGSADEERTRVDTAAHALLAEENAASALTIDAVAARAGVARAQVQRRFGTPTRLLEAIRVPDGVEALSLWFGDGMMWHDSWSRTAVMTTRAPRYLSEA